MSVQSRKGFTRRAWKRDQSNTEFVSCVAPMPIHNCELRWARKRKEFRVCCGPSPGLLTGLMRCRLCAVGCRLQCFSKPGRLCSGAQVPGMYMQVETRTSTRLHLKRAPGIRSWSLLVGILSTGLAAAYYSGDSLGWKLFYVTGCLFVAVQNLEDWEEAIFNKSTGKVILKTFSLYKKLLTLLRAGHDQVVVLLKDIQDVNVEEEKVRYFGKGYMVVLRFATGFSHPLTQSAVMGRRSDVEAIAELLTSFLELHRLESPSDQPQSSDSEPDGQS